VRRSPPPCGVRVTLVFPLFLFSSGASGSASLSGRSAKSLFPRCDSWHPPSLPPGDSLACVVLCRGYVRGSHESLPVMTEPRMVNPTFLATALTPRIPLAPAFVFSPFLTGVAPPLFPSVYPIRFVRHFHYCRGWVLSYR